MNNSAMTKTNNYTFEIGFGKSIGNEVLVWFYGMTALFKS